MSFQVLSRTISSLVRRSAQRKCLLEQPHRCGSYLGSSVVDPNTKYPDVEVSKNPEEWKWVERLLPRKTVAEPPTEFKEYPSGWKPLNPEALNLPYFIGRSRNHMPSVYLKIGGRGERRTTYVKHIQGDIWQLKEDLYEMVERRMGFKHGIYVNELNGVITIKGDVYNLVLQFFEEKGF